MTMTQHQEALLQETRDAAVETKTHVAGLLGRVDSLEKRSSRIERVFALVTRCAFTVGYLFNDVIPQIFKGHP